jgi:hypothetical protein
MYIKKMMKPFLTLALMIFAGLYLIAQPNEGMVYFNANFCSAYNPVPEEFVKKQLFNLKGDIKTISQLHYVLISDDKGNKVERLERGYYTFGYEFNKEHKIVSAWTYNASYVRTGEIKYRNFKNQLKLLSPPPKGDTVIQSASDGWTNYYVNDKMVKQEMKQYGLRRLYVKTGDGAFERRTYVKGVFQESEKYDKNDNLIHLTGHELSKDGAIVRTYEGIHQHDKNRNRIWSNFFRRNGSDTLSKGKWLYEYHNGQMVTAYLVTGEEKQLREAYTYNEQGDWITSLEHLLDYIHKYRYDDHGNWIEHEIFEKENFRESKHVATIRRTIEYY